MDEPIYRDIAVFAGERTDDAWDAMAESYEWVGKVLIALLQQTGRTRLPADWFELADGFVMTADPLPDGRLRLQAVRRGEVRSDSRDGQARLREKWERLYVRRSDVDGG